MKVSETKELFRSLTKLYFTDATVIFAKQSRTPKPQIPLVTLTFGNVNGHSSPNCSVVNGINVNHYQSRISIQVDLFTNGKSIIDDGNVVAYENTAMDEMLSYMDFLKSDYVIEWCHNNDVAIAIDGDAQDLTGVINDTNYEFRSRLSVLFYFMRKETGFTDVIEGSETGYFTQVEIKEETGK